MRRTPIRAPHGGMAMTLADIATELGTSTERVRQIEKRALEKLRTQLQELGINPEHILPLNYDEPKQ